MRRSRFISILIWILILAVIAVLAGTLDESFWVDESLTAYFVADSPHRILELARDHPINPLFLFYQYALTHMVGSSEVWMRAGSLLALIVSLFVIRSIGKRIGAPFSGDIAAALLVGSEVVLRASVYARPYSLALLMALISIWFLLSWLEHGRIPYLIAHSLFGALAISMHYLFVLPGFAVLLFVMIVQWSLRGRWLYLGMSIITAIATALANSNLFTVIAGSRATSSAPAPSWEPLLALFSPYGLIIILILAFIRKRTANHDLSICIRHLQGLALSLILVPPAIAAIVSVSGAASIFIPRYLIGSAIGWALLGALISARTRTPGFAAIASSLSALLSALLLIGSQIHPEDWRGAAAYLKQNSTSPSHPILVYSGLVEARAVIEPDNVAQREYLLSPATYYSIPAEPCPLAYPATEQAAAMAIMTCLSRSTRDLRQIALLARNEIAEGLPACEIYSAAIGKASYKISEVRYFGAVCLLMGVRHDGKDTD